MTGFECYLIQYTENKSFGGKQMLVLISGFINWNGGYTDLRELCIFLYINVHIFGLTEQLTEKKLWKL